MKWPTAPMYKFEITEANGTEDVIKWRGELMESNRLEHRGLKLFDYKVITPSGIVVWGDEFGPSPLHSSDIAKVVLDLMIFMTDYAPDSGADYDEIFTPEEMIWFNSSECQQQGYLFQDLEIYKIQYSYSLSTEGWDCYLFIDEAFAGLVLKTAKVIQDDRECYIL